MEDLASFFEQRVGHLNAPDLSKDLRFAARYTEALLDALPADDAAATHVQSADDAVTSSSGQAGSSIERSVTEEGHHESLLTLEMLESDAARPPPPLTGHREGDGDVMEQPPLMQLRPGAKGLSFKGPHAVENVPWQPALATVDEDAFSTISSLDLESPLAISVSDNEELLRQQAPVEEAEVPDIPRELQGRRLSSRTWFESDPQFSELIGKIKQWRDSNPDYDFTTIRGGPDRVEDHNSHFCRAVALGISALADIKCEHPLDPAVVRHLDIDVLRFVRLALWDWTNGRAERKAERESLEIVRKEIRVRKGEMAAKTWSSEVKPRAESAVSGDGSPWELLFDNEELDSRYAPAPNVQRKRLRQSFQTADTIIDPEDSDVDLAFAWLDANHDPADDDLSSIKFEPMLQDPETVKAIKVASSSDSDNFSTLLERSARAAPGISTGPTASLESMPSKLLPLVQTERLARLEWENEILRQKVAELQGGLAELQEELESLTPLDMPPIGSRTDSLQAHPLQYLVGQRLQPSSSSMQAEVDSTSDDALDEDDDLKRYTRDDMVSMLEFLKTEPPPVSRNVADDRSKEKWSHALLSRIRGPARASRGRPSLYDGDDRPSHACVPSKVPPTRAPPMKDPPTRALRSSRARGRVHIPEKEVSSREPPLHSGYIWPQPAGMSMKEV